MKNSSHAAAPSDVPTTMAFHRDRPNRADRKPTSTPQTAIASVEAEIAQPAVALSMPMPSVMIGMPHSRVNTTSRDSPDQWMKKPCQAVRLPSVYLTATIGEGPGPSSWFSTSPRRPSASSPGVSHTTTKATIPTSKPTAPREMKPILQPADPTSARKGTADRNCPNCPTAPVAWPNSGAVRSGNHAGMIRMTDRNAVASPAPTSTRARTATGKLVVNANNTWPTAISTAP